MRSISVCLALVVVAAAFLAAGCSDEDDQPARTAAQTAEPPSGDGSGGGAGAGAPPPPDAGVATGHGADTTRVTVPRNDATPPTATISLAEPDGGRTLGEAAEPGEEHGPTLELREPRLVGTTTGEDEDGGMSRVRILIREEVACERGNGERFERLRTRYLPPPEIERIRARPGVRLPTRRRRSRTVSLSLDRCGAGGRATEVRGDLWGQAINGSGLEAVTPHVRFVYRP